MAIRQATLDESVALYKSYCKSRGLSRRTLATYTNALEQLRGFMGASTTRCPLPTRQDLRAFIASLLEAGYARTTISIRMRAIRAFTNFLEREELVEVSPMTGVEIPRVPQSMPKILSAQEI